jgi:Protein of unknown function (DUF3515)
VPGRPHLTATALAGTLLVTGCGFGAVEVEPYEATPGSEQACAALLDAVPDVVSDAVRRDVEPASAPVAAWGDPPVVLRCGVPLPPEYRPDGQVLDIDGIGWYPVAGQGGTFFTTTDREPHVEVAVPADYAPEADVLVDLAAPITSTIPSP